jgi:hypothetical protein
MQRKHSNEMLAPWFELSRTPNSSPHLHETITQVIDDEVQEIERSSVPDIELLLKDYLRSEWNPLAKDETPKRFEISRCRTLSNLDEQEASQVPPRGHEYHRLNRTLASFPPLIRVAKSGSNQCGNSIRGKPCVH